MYLQRTIKEIKAKHHNAITGDELIDRVLQNRGVADYSDINYSLSNLIAPWTMKDLDPATDTIIKHIKLGSRILIVGDYDADGATSTTIAVEGLRMCGATDVHFVVPDRVVHGYGLTPSIVRDIEHLEPDLLITVDNGVSSFDGAIAVKELKRPCELVVTDHHLAAPQGLPEAAAIVNPNRPDCEFPSKNIAGCGVIFYVIMALRAKMRDNGIFTEMGLPCPNLMTLLDVLAVGTVADLVKLDGNNRNIVASGLDIINKCRARPGIMAIIKVAGKDPQSITSTDIGFVIGPRINAAGRMADMTVGIRCLLATNMDEAMEYARELDKLNTTRKETQREMLKEADDMTSFDSEKDGVTVYKDDWHEGVIGILASQIKQKLNRPIICFTKTEPENGSEMIKGSARSVDGIHLKHVLDEIKVEHPHILKKFGGHAMAAGLSLEEKYYDEFSALFDSYISKHMTPDIRDGVCFVDLEEVNERSLTLNTAKKLEAMGPWGQAFELPVFAGIFDIVDFRILKEKHLKMQLKKGNSVFDGIAFNCIDEETGENPFNGRVKIIFTMDINRFRGKESLQLMVDYIENVDVQVRKTNNTSKTFVKEGAGRQNRDLDGACKLFDT